MSTPAKPRTVIVCLPAHNGPDCLTATTTVAGRTDNPPRLAPVFPVRRGLFRFLSGFTHREAAGRGTPPRAGDPGRRRPAAPAGPAPGQAGGVG
jgi:hypothetical protein